MAESKRGVGRPKKQQDNGGNKDRDLLQFISIDMSKGNKVAHSPVDKKKAHATNNKTEKVDNNNDKDNNKDSVLPNGDHGRDKKETLMDENGSEFIKEVQDLISLNSDVEDESSIQKMNESNIQTEVSMQNVLLKKELCKVNAKLNKLECSFENFKYFMEKEKNQWSKEKEVLCEKIEALELKFDKIQKCESEKLDDSVDLINRDLNKSMSLANNVVSNDTRSFSDVFKKTVTTQIKVRKRTIQIQNRPKIRK